MNITKPAIILTAIFFFIIKGYTETAVEKGARIMNYNDNQPIFQKIKGEALLEIYGSNRKIRFFKKMIMASYTENMGTPDEVEHYICYFKEPPDDMGNSYLAHNYKSSPDVKYVYLKGIRKAKKVTGADKKLGFFGSDFTNGDIGKPDITECNYRYLRDEKVSFKGKEFDCYVVESIPKTPQIVSDTGYGRKITFIEKNTLLTLKLEYFDENLSKIKELRLISFLVRDNVKGQKVYYTSGIEMRNVKRGTRTILEFKNMKFENDANINPAIFSVQYMNRKWW